MNFDFDAFEFTGLIAPGSIVVLTVALLYCKELMTRLPTPLTAAQSAVVIVSGLIAAYVIGHLVAAIGNLAEPLLRQAKWGAPKLASLSDEQWLRAGYITEDQLERLKLMAETKLHRNHGLGEPGTTQRRTAVKQMHLVLVGSESGKRLETFNGLHNLSRGLAISFVIVAALSIVEARSRPSLYLLAVLSVIAAALALYRSRKFNRHYSTELLQQFILLPL